MTRNNDLVNYFRLREVLFANFLQRGVEILYANITPTLIFEGGRGRRVFCACNTGSQGGWPLHLRLTNGDAGGMDPPPSPSASAAGEV